MVSKWAINTENVNNCRYKKMELSLSQCVILNSYGSKHNRLVFYIYLKIQKISKVHGYTLFHLSRGSFHLAENLVINLQMVFFPSLPPTFSHNSAAIFFFLPHQKSASLASFQSFSFSLLHHLILWSCLALWPSWTILLLDLLLHHLKVKGESSCFTPT